MICAVSEAGQRQCGADVRRNANAVHQVVGGAGEAVQIRHRHAVADQVYRASLRALYGHRLAAVLHAIHITNKRDARRCGIDDVVGHGLGGLVTGGVGGGDNELRAGGVGRTGEQRHNAGAGVDPEVHGVVQAVSDPVRIGGGRSVDGVAGVGAVRNVNGSGRAGKDRHGVVHHHAAAGNDGKIACRIHRPGMIGAFSEVGGGDRCRSIGSDGRAGPLIAGRTGNVAELADHDVIVDQVDGAAFAALHVSVAVMVQHDEIFVGTAVGVKFLHVEVVARDAAGITVPGHHVLAVCTGGGDLWVEVGRAAGSLQLYDTAHQAATGIEFLHIDVPIRAAQTHPGNDVAAIAQRRDAR